MNKYMIVILLVVSLFDMTVAHGQNGYRLQGVINGLKDGTQITLKSLTGKRTRTVTNEGEFRFVGKVEMEGVPHVLEIAGQERTLNLLLDNAVEIMLNGRLEDWPICKAEALNLKGSYLDFQQRIQVPFSSAFKQYQKTMKSLTGKSSFEEWGVEIKQGKGVDSLRMALPKEIYSTATQTYIKEVFLWIGMYPDSYFSPELIKRWWPEADKLNAYNRLSPKVKNSYYGRILYKQLTDN